MSNVHEYPVSVDWKGAREGSGTVVANRSGTSVALAVPPEFQGTGEGSNPEELLTCAIAGCYSITFGIVAANRKLPVVGLKVEATGTVEQQGAMPVFTKVKILPTITMEASTTDEQMKIAEDMAHKADLYCIITNAVRGKVEITVEPTLVKE